MNHLEQHYTIHLSLWNYCYTLSMRIAMVTYSMCITIVPITWNSKHEDAVIWPEACCTDVDLNNSFISLQWQKPEGWGSVRRQWICSWWLGYAGIRVKIGSAYFEWFDIFQKALSSVVLVLCFLGLVMVTINEEGEGNKSARDREFLLSSLQIRASQQGLWSRTVLGCARRILKI